MLHTGIFLTMSFMQLILDLLSLLSTDLATLIYTENTKSGLRSKLQSLALRLRKEEQNDEDLEEMEGAVVLPDGVLCSDGVHELIGESSNSDPMLGRGIVRRGRLRYESKHLRRKLQQNEPIVCQRSEREVVSRTVQEYLWPRAAFLSATIWDATKRRS